MSILTYWLRHYSVGDFRNCEPMSAEHLAAAVSRHADADVTVDIGGVFLDVCQASFDPDREKVVLHLHPDDVADVLRRIAGAGRR